MRDCSRQTGGHLIRDVTGKRVSLRLWRIWLNWMVPFRGDLVVVGIPLLLPEKWIDPVMDWFMDGCRCQDPT